MNLETARRYAETSIAFARRRDEFVAGTGIGEFSAYTVADHVATLEKLGDKAKRLAEQACNGIPRYDAKVGRVLSSWTDEDEAHNDKALEKIRAKASEIAKHYQLVVIQCGGDPRGSCLKLADKDRVAQKPEHERAFMSADFAF